MSRRSTEDQFDMENDSATTGPVRQSGGVRVKASRSRTTARRKVRSADRKTTKVEGMHRRANKRISW